MTSPSEEQTNIAYAKTIEILFDGVITASPDDITSEVIYHVDNMIQEIAKCSAHMTELSFKLIYKAAMMAIGPVIDAYSNNFYQRVFIKQGGGKSWEKVLLQWIQSLQGNRRHMLCLATARSRYRSRITSAILGL